MPEKLTFVPAGPEDAETLCRWNLDHAKIYETATLDWNRVGEQLEEKVRRDLPFCRAVFLGGEKAGFFTLLRRPDFLELDSFFVFPPFQGRGVGSRVLRYCIDEAKKAGLPLRLCVFCKNEGALRLYRRAGFLETAKFHQSRILMEYRPE